MCTHFERKCDLCEISRGGARNFLQAPNQKHSRISTHNFYSPQSHAHAFTCLPSLPTCDVTFVSLHLLAFDTVITISIYLPLDSHLRALSHNFRLMHTLQIVHDITQTLIYLRQVHYHIHSRILHAYKRTNYFFIVWRTRGVRDRTKAPGEVSQITDQMT